MSRIDSAIARFAELPGASVGRGPRHPTEPDSSAASRIEEFLDTYPALLNDPEYVEFLEKYAGASVVNEAASQLVDVLGFTDASLDLEEDFDAAVVDEDGFLMVATAIYHLMDNGATTETLQHGFAYNVVDEGPFHLYQAYSSDARLGQEYTPAYSSFADWLEQLVAHEGWFDPPGHR